MLSPGHYTIAGVAKLNIFLWKTIFIWKKNKLWFLRLIIHLADMFVLRINKFVISRKQLTLVAKKKKNLCFWVKSRILENMNPSPALKTFLMRKTLINVISWYCIMRCTNIWKICITQWTNIFKVANAQYYNHAWVEDPLKDYIDKPM